MPRQPLDEVSLRRPEFSEGHKATLGDGQEWSFPRPRLRLVPTKGQGGKTGLRCDSGHDPEYASLRDDLFDCAEEDTWTLLGLQMQIACYLLLKNYDLTEDQIGILLYFELDDLGNAAMWESLADAIYAVLPKPSANGSESA